MTMDSHFVINENQLAYPTTITAGQDPISSPYEPKRMTHYSKIQPCEPY